MDVDDGPMGKRSTQFEHTLLCTKDGVEAVTGKNEKKSMYGALFGNSNPTFTKDFGWERPKTPKAKAEALNAIILG